MNSSSPSSSTSTNTSSNSESESEVSTMVQSQRARFFKTYQRQSFSLPDSIMFYVAKNPTSSELYETMTEMCKDFFVKKPLLVISNLIYECDGWREKPIDLDIKLTSQFWITSEFRFESDDSGNQNIVSSFTPKIFRCDVERLTIYSQILSFADICILTTSAEEITFDNVTVKQNDGTIVGIEKIVEVATKAKLINLSKLSASSVTSKTMKELIEIPHFSEINHFSMKSIPEAFDVEAFYDYMKKNQHTRFILGFDNSISDAYANRLKEITDEILGTEVFDYKPPDIQFP